MESIDRKPTDRKIKQLRTDNGLEFCENLFMEFYSNNGIARYLIVGKNSQQNGLAERMNKTILERVTCMVSFSGLPKSFLGRSSIDSVLLDK